jgi:hypothetical protein
MCDSNRSLEKIDAARPDSGAQVGVLKPHAVPVTPSAEAGHIDKSDGLKCTFLVQPDARTFDDKASDSPVQCVAQMSISALARPDKINFSWERRFDLERPAQPDGSFLHRRIFKGSDAQIHMHFLTTLYQETILPLVGDPSVAKPPLLASLRTNTGRCQLDSMPAS